MPPNTHHCCSAATAYTTLRPASPGILLAPRLNSGRRFTARDLLELRIESRGHSADIPPQIGMACGRPLQIRFEQRTNRADGEGKHRSVDPGGHATHEERLVAEIGRHRLDRADSDRGDLVGGVT